MPSRRFPKILSDEDIKKIIEVIKTSPNYHNNFLRIRDYYCLMLLRFSGLRPGEMINLKWEDIDFEKRLIHVKPYFNKQRNDLPAVLTLPAERYLKEYKQKLEEMKIYHDCLFPSFWTGKPTTEANFARKFREICTEANILKVEYIDSNNIRRFNFRPYSMRHTFLTEVYKKTRSDIAVSRLARHTQVASASLYTHLDDDFKIRIADEVFQ